MEFHIDPRILKFVIAFPMLFLSIVVHEVSHAYAAYKLGDNTAKDAGRLTLNPFKHIELFGTIILPLIGILSGFSMIGWAKPVPVNPHNFSNLRRDDFIVTAMGPGSNFLLVFVFALLITILPEVSLLKTSDMDVTLRLIFYYGILINLFLAFFNLLPLPPLDGFHIINSVLNFRLSPLLEKFSWLGFFILIILINSPLWGYFSNLIGTIFNYIIELTGR